MKMPILLRVAALLQIVGLCFELAALHHLTPATFLAFAGIGMPLVGAGILLYLVYVVRTLGQRGAL